MLLISGVSAPSIEDSMAMVAVALVLYGMIKFLSWTFSSSGKSFSLITTIIDFFLVSLSHIRMFCSIEKNTVLKYI